MNLKTLEKEYENAIRKNWDKFYIAIDLHDTIVYGNYNKNVLPTEFCPGAKETLCMLSKREDIILILYTCSWPKEIEKYLEFFKKHNIKFKYVNENPEVENEKLGYYTHKFYFNILLENKAGFDCDKDWQTVENFFELQPILKTKNNIKNIKNTDNFIDPFNLDMNNFNFLSDYD